MEMRLSTRFAVLVLALGCALSPELRATEYFVDANGGDDSYNGLRETWAGGTSKDGPRKTLAAALQLATEKDDVVIALPGRYDRGVSNPEARDTDQTLNRVSLSDGIALKSRDGAEVTFIVGEESIAEDATATKCGQNAVRCVYMTGRSVLEGFTVCGGRTNNKEVTVEGSYGGGVCNTDSGATVVDCVISNNAAWKNGGGANFGNYYRCRFHGNSAPIGADANQVTAANCLFAGGEAYRSALDACTFVGCAPRGGTIRNTIVTAAFSEYAGSPTLVRCLLAVAPTGAQAGTMTDCIVTNLEAIAVGANGCLGPESAALDRADRALYEQNVPAARRDFDAFGAKRVANAAQDIGCCERSRYEEFGRCLSVLEVLVITNATPNVRLADDGIELADADELVGCFDRSLVPDDARIELDVGVLGSGSLAVYLGNADEPVLTISESSGPGHFVLPSGEDGVLFRFAGDGRATILGLTAFSYAVVEKVGNGISVTGDAGFGTNIVGCGGSLRFTVSRTDDKAEVCQGVSVNGDFYSFSDYPYGKEFVVSDADRRSSVVVCPVYRTGPRDWFVDAVNGDDDYSGMYTNRAFRTLAAAVANDRYAAGETIWVLPGEYKDGECVGSAGRTRVLLSEGMKMRSLGGTDVTSIVGEADLEGDKNLCGPNAVRCVQMAKNTFLEGFALKNGHTTSDSYGGAVWGDGATSLIAGCTVTGNGASRGGALFTCGAVGCRFSGNSATVGYDAYAASPLVNCYFACDRAGYGLYSGCDLYNCTLDDGGGTGVRNSCRLYNTLCRNASFTEDAKSTFDHCVMCALPPDVDGASQTNACLVVGLEEMSIRKDLSPRSSNVGIDAGDTDGCRAIMADFPEPWNDCDITKRSRINNGIVDIGCGEYVQGGGLMLIVK